MLSDRALLALAQFLSLFEGEFLWALLAKYDLDADYVHEAAQMGMDPVRRIGQVLDPANDEQLLALLGEVGRTSGDLRNRITPRYRFDERFRDLRRCLELDGFVLRDEGVERIEPVVEGEEAVEDTLSAELKASDLTDQERILNSLRRSEEAYRTDPFDYNACLTHARVALQSLARAIAERRRHTHPSNFDPESWGEVLAYLRSTDLITTQEERGLAGVFTFLSPGAHRLIGIGEREMARLGRSLAIGMCLFLIRRAAA